MGRDKSTARRQALRAAGILAATTFAALLFTDVAIGHEGQDHAPRSVPIRVDAQCRIVDLTYG